MSSPQPLSIANLLTLVRNHLTSSFSGLFIKGEISTIRRSGNHAYLTLKDTEGNASLNATIWDCNKKLLSFAANTGCRVEEFCEGAIVEIIGSMDVFPVRGSMQLNISNMRLVNERGNLFLQLEKTKEEIVRRGWHEDRHKKAIPLFPKKIGIITSADGAGLKDMEVYFAKHCPDIELVIYNCLVQGKNSPSDICRAIDLANRQQYCDLLIVGRGGGAFEDLLAFYQLPVVEAVFYSTIPIISAVGHQVDSPFTDLVADAYALTPTDAASKVCKPRLELKDKLVYFFNRITGIVKHSFINKERELRYLDQRLDQNNPKKVLLHIQENINTLNSRLKYAFKYNYSYKVYNLNNFTRLFYQYNPLKIFREQQLDLNTVSNSLNRLYLNNLEQKETKLELLQKSLSFINKNAIYDINQNLSKVAQLHKQINKSVKDRLNTKYRLQHKEYTNLVSFMKSQTTTKAADLLSIANVLYSLDPNLPINRGYALLEDFNGQLITSIDTLPKTFKVKLKDGSFIAKLEEGTVVKHNPQAEVQKELKVIKEALSFFRKLK